MFDFDRDTIIKKLKDNKIDNLDDKLKDGSVYELEAKFLSYDYDEKKFTSGVPYVHYIRLIEILDKNDNYDRKIEKSDVSIYENNIREISIDKEGEREIIYEEKIQIDKNIDITNYNVRVSLNKEKLIDITNYNIIPIGLTRGRIRRSYYSKIYPIIIDITEITEEIDSVLEEDENQDDEILVKESKIIKIKYEVEVEYHGSRSEIQDFFDIVEETFKLMKGTKNIYSNQIKSKLDNDISLLLKIKPTSKNQNIQKYEYKYNKITSKYLVKARNIKYRDLVYGGIVGNNSIKNKNVLVDKNKQGTDYYITYKADGIRKYFIIHDTGIWLVYPDDEYNLLITSSDEKYSRFINSYKNSVFDTELVNLKVNQNNIEHFVLGFDCLVFGGINVENKSYKERLQYCNILSGKLNDSIITFQVKEAILLPDDPKLFFILIKDFYQKREFLNWGDDGFIFTPNNVIYNTRSQTIKFKVINNTLNVWDNNKYIKFIGTENKIFNNENVEFTPYFNNKIVEYYWNGKKLIPIKEAEKADTNYSAIKIWDDITSPDVSPNKLLTNTPDVCKWKPPKDLTIDFLIKIRAGLDNSRNLNLYVFDGDKQVKFNGTDRYPLNQNNIRMKGPNFTIDETLNNKIIEFEWIKENDTIILQPRKYRKDKNNPNQKIIAEDVWEDIMDPILIEDLIGDTPELAIKYHNKIKQNLYYQTGLEFKRNYNLLDIGSGRGGDIGKWLKFNGNIIAVEPYKVNRDDLIKRINKSKIKHRVTVVPLGGEKTVEITKAVKENIPGGKVDVVSLMLSMSFFWSSDKHLDALVNTIVTNLKPGGKIIFLTIDGDSLEELFNTNNKKVEMMKIAGSKIHLYPQLGKYWGRPVDFELPGSIIEEGGQREYVVHLKNFTDKLSKYGFILENISKAIEPNLLLSEQNLIYTSLYSYGSYINIDDDKLKEIDINIELPIIPNPKKLPEDSLQPLKVSITSIGSAIDDDTYAPINCKWFNNLFRIATIDDNNSFLHCILKAFYPKYQNNNDCQFRLELVTNIRNQLAVILNYGNPDDKQYTYWETVGCGIFPKMVMKQIIDPMINDYTLQGLTKLFNSREILYPETYIFLAELFNINIYVVKITKDDIESVTNRIYKFGRKNIVISEKNNHFELITIDVDGLFQSVFDDDDELIKEAELRYPKNKPDIEIFNPDQTFIFDFIETFTINDKFVFPKEIYSLHPNKNDPFRKSLDLLYDTIINIVK